MNCSNCQGALTESQHFCQACGTPVAPASSEFGEETAATVDPLLGTTLGGRFKILKMLGEGGMGAVYVGEQKLGTNARKVAVKTLHPHLSTDPKVLARFERECGTVAELEHPNTIQVYDFGKTETGLLYIVMEYVQGQSLADILEKGGPLSPERTLAIMKQVAGSLEEAHQRGIVHRDLKPDNIVLTERAGTKDFVKVLDFGIAKRSGEEDKNEQKLTQQGMVLGTPPYMSPEQFSGQPIDARSDIYSLAIMAYEMVAGALPYRANTAWEWATQHMTQPPIPFEAQPRPPHLPPAMKAAIFRGLEKSPDRRFATVREFIDAFGGAMPEGMPMAPPQNTRVAGAAGMQTEAAPMIAGARMPTPQGGTQMGEPVMPPGNYVAGYSGQGPMQTPPVGYAYGTPAAGNHAFPTGSTPYGAPPIAEERRGPHPLIFVALGIAVLSGIAIFFAMRGSSSPAPASGATGTPIVIDTVPSTAVLTPIVDSAPLPAVSAPLAPTPTHVAVQPAAATTKATSAPTPTPAPTPAPTPYVPPLPTSTRPAPPTANPAVPLAELDPRTRLACEQFRAWSRADDIMLRQRAGEALRRCHAGGGSANSR